MYPVGYCEHLIKEFNCLEEGGAGSNRQKSENANRHYKDDYQIFIELRNHNLEMFEDKNSCSLFFKDYKCVMKITPKNIQYFVVVEKFVQRL